MIEIIGFVFIAISAICLLLLCLGCDHTLVLICLPAFFVTGICCFHETPVDPWNDGYCSCGKEWVIFDIERGKYDTDFYYKCENDHLMKSDYIRK